MGWEKHDCLRDAGVPDVWTSYSKVGDIASCDFVVGFRNAGSLISVPVRCGERWEIRLNPSGYQRHWAKVDDPEPEPEPEPEWPMGEEVRESPDWWFPFRRRRG